MAVATQKRGTDSRPRAPRPPSTSCRAPHIAPVPFEHEELVVRRGPRSGVNCIVAIHSTALGPALGGLRMWHYRDDRRRGPRRPPPGRGDDLQGRGRGARPRRRQGRDLRAADGLAGEQRHAALLDFADLVESLGGRYITAEDVGISPGDMVAIGERTDHLAGLPADCGGTGDPSPFTAIGVEAAMRACARRRFGAARPRRAQGRGRRPRSRRGGARERLADATAVS